MVRVKLVLLSVKGGNGTAKSIKPTTPTSHVRCFSVLKQCHSISETTIIIYALSIPLKGRRAAEANPS